MQHHIKTKLSLSPGNVRMPMLVVLSIVLQPLHCVFMLPESVIIVSLKLLCIYIQSLF